MENTKNTSLATKAFLLAITLMVIMFVIGLKGATAIEDRCSPDELNGAERMSESCMNFLESR